MDALPHQQGTPNRVSQNQVNWFDLSVVVILTAAIYLWRLDAIPICGEEPRWACGAVQMLETGDWIVPRQQGQIFPERPPMSSWAMAVAAMVRGEMDWLAIRFPSCLAIILNSIVITWYAGRFLARLGAVSAGLIYATLGQVMQIGRMGESEALFTLFLSSALMVWHWLYQGQASATRFWILGYALAALAALVKGIQAPVYFVAATNSYLAYRRDWFKILHRGQLGGLAVFVLVVGLWQIPFYFKTDLESVIAIWWGLAGDRLTWNGLFIHVATYPWETLGCLAPWSILLGFVGLADVRKALGRYRELLSFLVIAVAITYPSVWFASMARGRYFMPLYPLIAVGLGTIVECCAPVTASERLRKHWYRTVQISAVIVFATSVALMVALIFPSAQTQLPLSHWQQAIVAAMSLLLGGGLWFMSHDSSGRRALPAFLTFVAYLGLLHSTIVVEHFARTWNDPRSVVQAVRSQLPQPDKFVSFGPADHRFVYFFGQTIPELPWPTTVEQIPESVEYFCFDWHQGDTTERRANGRGRSWSTTTGTLPFEWEEVATVNCERRPYRTPGVVTVIARIVSRESHLANQHTLHR